MSLNGSYSRLVTISDDLESCCDSYDPRTRQSIWSQKRFYKSVNRFDPLMPSRSHVSLCNYRDKYVYATGGMIRNPVRLADRFNLVTKRWETVAALNYERIWHSSCALGAYVYVFCGQSS